MKNIVLNCLLLMLSVVFFSSCEVQTEGLLPPEPSKNAPPAYVIAAVRLQYPNATDMKVTVIEPNKLWKVEFMVNGQPFETYMDENARRVTSGRQGLVDETEAIKKILAHWRGKYGSHVLTSTHFNKVKDPYTQKVLFYYIWEGGTLSAHPAENNKIYAALYDNQGSVLSESSFDYNLSEAYPADHANIVGHNVYFDIKNRQLNWIKYKIIDAPKPNGWATTTNEPIMNTLKKLKWDDFSGITPVLQPEDYPANVGDAHLSFFSLYIVGNTSINERFTFLSLENSMNSLFGMRNSWTSPVRMKYWKFLDEVIYLPELLTKLDGTPLYILEDVNYIYGFPTFDYNKINNVSQVPSGVISEISRRGLPPIAQIIVGEKYKYYSESKERYYLFYRGANDEIIQFGIDLMNTNDYGFQKIVPITEAELKPNLMNTVKAQYPNMKPLKYFSYQLDDKMNVIEEANGQEIMFESDGKVYSAKFINVMGFDKPYIEQLY